LKKASGLNLKMIAPDHGPVWRTDLSKIVNLYARWAARRPTNKAVIMYDSMWESTSAMASAIEDGLVSEGVQVKSMRVRDSHRSHIATEVLDAGALIVGSPTLNNGMFPTVADALTYLRGLRPRNLVGASFGSFGWGGEAAKLIADVLDDMRVERVDEPLRIQFVPDKQALLQCRELGCRVARKLHEKMQQSSGA